jgi:hypothetical protein
MSLNKYLIGKLVDETDKGRHTARRTSIFGTLNYVVLAFIYAKQ